MKWRLIPKIRFTNYRKEYPNMSINCFKDLFSIQRWWRNRIIDISVKHYTLSFDFRRNWLMDMYTGGK